MNHNIHKITVKSRKRETSKMFAIITFRERTTFLPPSGKREEREGGGSAGSKRGAARG